MKIKNILCFSSNYTNNPFSFFFSLSYLLFISFRWSWTSYCCTSYIYVSPLNILHNYSYIMQNLATPIWYMLKMNFSLTGINYNHQTSSKFLPFRFVMASWPLFPFCDIFMCFMLKMRYFSYTLSDCSWESFVQFVL